MSIFDAQYKETCYDKTIIFYLYMLFGTTIGYDKLNPIINLILSLKLITNESFLPLYPDQV